MKVFVSTSSFCEYNGQPVEALKKVGLEPVLNSLRRTLKTDEILAYANDCVGIIAGTENYGQELLSRLPRLRVISRCGAGLDSIDVEAAKEAGITVVNTPYGPTQAVAELTVALILNLIRHVESSSTNLKRGAWTKQMGFLISEVKIGILGLGKVGKRVTELLRAFDANVMGCDNAPNYGWAKSNSVSIESHELLIKESDVFSLHLPYQKELNPLLGEKQLALMKPGSYLINTSRGRLIDEKALYLALKAGHLGGAAIDVFEREPYDGPLRELDNVILTPHIGSYARAGRIRMEQESVENLITEFQRLKLLGV